MRKQPRQKRSREMVTRLLDATASTIAEVGLDHTTTNRIAANAGVSIGSLYQYFPDKEALVEALLERQGRNIGGLFRSRAEQFNINDMALRDIASGAIAYGLYMMRNDPLFAELVRNWGRLPIELIMDPIEQMFLVMAQPYFLRKYRDYPVRDLEQKLYVLINSVLFTCLRYVQQENNMIREGDFIRTLTDMIVSVLEVPRAQGATQ